MLNELQEVTAKYLAEALNGLYHLNKVMNNFEAPQTTQCEPSTLIEQAKDNVERAKIICDQGSGLIETIGGKK